MTKRPDIQIARTVAVIAVVGFHLGVPGFTNGFLGVDAFFVISGFLMGLLYTRIGALDFYRRRLTRLLPSLLTVSILFLFLGLILLQPFEIDELSTQIVTGILGISNIAYWSQDSYFQPNRFRPLLNLWSLGVEIQFYLLFPLLLFLKRKSKFILPALALLSFGLNILVLQISPKTSFFLLPTRLWEFLVGVWIACTALPELNKKVKRASLLLAGLIFIAAFLIPIDSNSTSWIHGHPGLNSILIVAATATILKLKLNTPLLQSFLGKMAVKIGDFSYEIYLVHFPLLVFLNYVAFSGTITEVENAGQAIIALLITFALSFLIYKLSMLRAIRKPLVLSSSVVILSLILFVAPISKVALTGNSEISEVTSFALADRSPYRCGKIFRITQPKSELCLISGEVDNSRPNLLLFGNSHADMIKREVVEVSDDRANVYFWVQNSPFQLEVEQIKNSMSKYGISKVLIHSSTFNPNLEILKKLLAETKDVEYVMLGSVPTYSSNLPKIIYEANPSKNADFSEIDLRPYIVPDSLLGDDFYKDVESPNFKYISTLTTMCSDSKCAWHDDKNRLYYFDTDHLTLTGAHALKEPISRSLDSLLGNPGF